MDMCGYFVLLVAILTTYTARADDCNNEDKREITLHRLKKDLLCGYEKTLRPVVDVKTPTTIIFRMILKYFSYNDLSNTFMADSWLAMYWKDEHLKWNPDSYDSVKNIHLSTDEIWKPDISVYNRNVQSGSAEVVDSATCIVTSTGSVVCVPPSHQESLCVPDLTKYPFDTQNCTIRFGSWIHSGEEIDLQMAKPPLSLNDLVPNGEWHLEDQKVYKHPGKFKCCPNNTYPSINFSFKLRRLSGAHSASVILPAIALIIIMLTSLWISADHKDRVNLCCVNLVCQFLYSQYVSWMVPLHGRNIPLIILFGRDSLLLAAFALIFTIMFRRMLENTKPAPGWVSSIVSLVTACRPGRWCFLSEDSSKELAAAKGYEDDTTMILNSAGNPANSKDWLLFGKILDRLLFTCYCVIYICMFIAFTP